MSISYAWLFAYQEQGQHAHRIVQAQICKQCSCMPQFRNASIVVKAKTQQEREILEVFCQKAGLWQLCQVCCPCSRTWLFPSDQFSLSWHFSCVALGVALRFQKKHPCLQLWSLHSPRVFFFFFISVSVHWHSPCTEPCNNLPNKLPSWTCAITFRNIHIFSNKFLKRTFMKVDTRSTVFTFHIPLSSCAAISNVLPSLLHISFLQDAWSNLLRWATEKTSLAQCNRQDVLTVVAFQFPSYARQIWILKGYACMQEICGKKW